MDFTSLIKPVVLSSDPLVGQSGQLYFNSSSGVYRYFHADEWNTILSTFIPPTETVYQFGGPGINTFNLFVQEVNIGGTILAECNVEGTVSILRDSLLDLPLGSKFHIVRAGAGEINIAEWQPVDEENPEVEILAASDIFLTKQWDIIELTKIGANRWLINSEFRDLY